MPSPGPSKEILDPRSVPREASFKLGDGKGTGRHEPISLSESGQIEQADCFGEEGMENGAHELKSGLLFRSTICVTHTLSGVAPDAVVQRAMRHSSPETKRRYQLGM